MQWSYRSDAGTPTLLRPSPHVAIEDAPRTALFGSFRPLAWLGACFLAISATTRLALLVWVGNAIPIEPLRWLRIFAIGLAYDLVAFVYFAWPLVLLLCLLPRRVAATRMARRLVGASCFAALFVLLFIAAAEWTFWDEFQARFNFVAVDYLVYTTEVIGNIRESYPVGTILGAILVMAVAIFVATSRLRRTEGAPARFATRAMVFVAWLAVTVVATLGVSGDLKDRGDNVYADELSGNGIYQFFAAYRAASLDYPRYYRTLPINDAFEKVRAMLASPDSTWVSDTNPQLLLHDVHNAEPERRLNVVLVSVESLSARFSGTYGRVPSLTPELDKLTSESLLFTRLYASGTRTVRGLEALALSVPPTPGESIVKRNDNHGLYSLAGVFNSKGYRSQFLYGGYGAFDEMNDFFANNGYEVHDREEIPKERIHAANIWGVADEDLYTMALEQLDAAHARGQPLFAHVMTTSNHRPYTFPEGRGPWVQGERDSAVAYSDWAIGDFLRRARTRPWFHDTVFVLTADHCASSAGKASLPVFRYHIPLWIYSPGNVSPGRFDQMVAQIDIGPTVLGLLGMDYRSAFYGVDVLRREPGTARAFVSTYQLMGYLRNDILVELAPKGIVRTVRPTYDSDLPQPEVTTDERLAREAIAYYQTAAYRFANGLMRDAAPPAAGTEQAVGE